jgi:hypothetical protein
MKTNKIPLFFVKFYHKNPYSKYLYRNLLFFSKNRIFQIFCPCNLIKAYIQYDNKYHNKIFLDNYQILYNFVLLFLMLLNDLEFIDHHYFYRNFLLHPLRNFLFYRGQDRPNLLDKDQVRAYFLL